MRIDLSEEEAMVTLKAFNASLLESAQFKDKPNMVLLLEHISEQYVDCLVRKSLSNGINEVMDNLLKVVKE